jgi:uncharacterized protein (DUF2147 family)
MRSFKIFAIMLLVGFYAASAFSQVKADDIMGVWLNEDEDAHVEIENIDGVYFGKIVWLKEPVDEKTGQPKLDKENPDDELKKRPVMGMELLSDFRFDGKKEWKDGTIYDPKSGKTYSCYMVFTDNSKDRLKVRGFIGISLIGRTTYWTRVE